MHILIYIKRSGVGGVQRFVYMIAKELIKNNSKVSIFYHIPELALSDDFSQLKNINILTLSKNRYIITAINYMRNCLHWLDLRFDFKEWCNKKYFFYILKKYQIDIIHSNSEIGELLILAAKKKYNIPFIVTLHGFYKKIPIRDKAYTQNILRNLAAEAERIIYLSKDNLKPFREALKKKTADKQVFQRIYNGIEMPKNIKHIAHNNSTFTFGMIARGIPEKGWEQTIQAFVRLSQMTEKDIQLHLYGDETYYTKLAKKYKFVKNIYFKGKSNSPTTVIQNFHVGLLPSYSHTEEMPYTIIEYLVCGRPVISTYTGAVPEMIEDPQGNRAGVLVNTVSTRPAVEEIKMAMYNYLTNAALYQSHKNFALSASQKFNIKYCVEEYMKVYRHALNKKY